MFDNTFSALEVLEMAKDIEKNGYEFYNRQAQKAEDSELEQLLLKLASDEEKHYDVFDKLSLEIKNETKEESEYIYTPKVSSYLESLVEFSVFSPEKELETGSVKEVIAVAIRAEKDSILLYQEMLENNSGKTHEIIEKLIVEEKKHLMELMKYNARKK